LRWSSFSFLVSRFSSQVRAGFRGTRNDQRETLLQTYVIIAAVSYLLGSIPFGYILVRLFLKQDIRATGSGNIGATNVARSGAKGLAIATLLLDAGKGFVAVYAVGALAHGGIGEISINGVQIYDGPFGALEGAVAALFAILGHLFPIWLKFKGGKGVATGAGAFLAFAPKAVLLVLLVFAMIVVLFRYISLGSIVATAAFPVAVYLVTGYKSPLVLAIIGLCSLLIILKHHANIRRLLAGTEPKFGAKSTIPPPQEMEKRA
jgi:glycerol-3-phosphate acyltransferase PlsY